MYMIVCMHQGSFRPIENTAGCFFVVLLLRASGLYPYRRCINWKHTFAIPINDNGGNNVLFPQGYKFHSDC